jgi:amino acid adenylation domain-containing protein
MSDLQKRLDNLSPEQRELVFLKLQNQKQSFAKEEIGRTPSIEPISRNQLIPLSSSQERLWFLDQLEGKGINYNMAAAIKLLGPLQITALEQSVAGIVSRHEVLRTNFRIVNESPVQIIAPISTRPLAPIEVIELQTLTEDEQSDELERLAKEEAEKSFDLASDSLLRVTLIRIKDEEHVMLVTMHHIISDGWSIGIFIQELSGFYEAFSQGATADLPDLSIQYADFSHWQRQCLEGGIFQSQVDYWKQQLNHAPPLLELPTDRPRPTVQSFRGQQLEFILAPALTEQLQRLSRKYGVTLFMTLLSAFQVLLHRYSGQPDIVVGSPIANRNRREIEGLIGFFVNTLILRNQVDGQQSFDQLLQQVRKVTLDAYAHQDIPFEKLVGELQPERSLSYSPLFQVMFILQNAPVEILNLQDLQLETLAYENTTAKFDLILSLEETDKGLAGSWEYNTDLFNSSTIERMHRHFQILLEGIISNPQQQVADLPLLMAVERQQLLFDWNDTDAEFPSELCVHQLFEQQVERTPEAIAVVFEEQTLTYRELNEKANQLAHHLQSLGVAPDVPVGIYLERSLEMFIAILATLKAGGCCLPLDPTYPIERLHFMMLNAQASVLLTQQSLQTLGAMPATVTFSVDRQWDEIAHYPSENPTCFARAEHLFYLIYTSGSTGTPKGVALPQRALSNLISWHLQHVGPSAGTLQFASFGFDVSFLEMFAAWVSGGTLFVPNAHTRQDVEALCQFIASQRIDRVMLPVTLLQLWAEQHSEAPQRYQHLRQVITAGEQLQLTQAVIQLFEQLPNCELHNYYGPSETHVVTAYQCTGPTGQWPTHVPIGRPIGNTQIYVLDQHQQPVPLGVVGEIYIGGLGVARGYLNQPELTAEKFITDPFSDSPKGRLYRTGDLGRYLPDGNLEYIGRIDNQVKLRGFRIELGEIETALALHPQVAQAMVMVHRDAESAKEKCLVSYVVAKEGEQISVGPLRDYLKAKLPEYMVPSFFVLLEEIPLTPNGKIDRKALPQPEDLELEIARYVAPRTPAEEVLVQMWSEVLKREQVGIYDNFFELGGHSLLATQLTSRIRKGFGLELPLRDLLESQTVAELTETMASLFGGRKVIDEIARTIQEVEQLSEEDVQFMFEQLQAENQLSNRTSNR